MSPSIRQVRAVFDAESILVYQAYGHEIADAALAAGTFVAPFNMNRMTWIKPSFLWMMYRWHRDPYPCVRRGSRCSPGPRRPVRWPGRYRC